MNEAAKQLSWWKRPERILALVIALPFLVSGVLLVVPIPSRDRPPSPLRSDPSEPSGDPGRWPGRIDVPTPTGDATVDLSGREAALRAIGRMLEGLLVNAGENVQEAAKIGPRLAERFLTALAEETGKTIPGAALDLARWLLTRRPPEKPPQERFDVYFGTDGAEIDLNGQKVLQKVRAFAETHRDTVVLIRAFADTTASTPHNRRLARRRGNAIRDTLTVQGGLAKVRVFVSELGEEEVPLITADRTSERENRAAEIVVR